MEDGTLSNAAFHHLTNTQYMAILQIFAAVAWQAWSVACAHAGRSAGKVFTIFGSGVGACEMGQAVLGPFR